MNKIVLVLVFLLSGFLSQASNKIKIYFNHPVDTTVSISQNAIFLDHSMADTFVAYINRAQYSIDIAQFDYEQDSAYANIATAINNAYTRGVKIRWIYDGNISNSGLSLLNTNINTLASPLSGGGYNIMHNKFIVIDAKSTNPNDPIVVGGSIDWFVSEINDDYNNTVILQDSALAAAYTAEFNMMWGSTGLVPNASLSLFGPDKTDLGMHHFVIDGKTVELYFSPSDGTNSHIQSTISSATKDLYFGMYTFTDASDANMIMTKRNAGVYVAGIMDQFSDPYAPYSIFSGTGGLGATFINYTGSVIYHNKFLIVNASDRCADPKVLTGSHNWSSSANTKNDENTLIIHDDTVANLYYQSFYANFTSLGGTLTPQHGCGIGVKKVNAIESSVTIFPNPTHENLVISYQLAETHNVSISITNILGEKVADLSVNEVKEAGSHSIEYSIRESGFYFVNFVIDGQHFVKKLVVN